MVYFLSLPAEVRNMVYSYLSKSYQEPTEEEHIENERTEKRITDHFAYKVFTNILAVSRQVRNEALPVLFNDNTYHHYIYPHSRHGMYDDTLFADPTSPLGSHFPKAGGLMRKVHLHLELSGEVTCDIHNPSRYRSLVNLLRSICVFLARIPEMKELRLSVKGKMHHDWASFNEIEEMWGSEVRLHKMSFLYTRFSTVFKEFRTLLPWVQLERGIIELVDCKGSPALEHKQILLDCYSKYLIHRNMQNGEVRKRLKKVARKFGIF